MTLLALLLVAAPIVLGVYAYALYPLGLRIAARGRGRHAPPEMTDWPPITIVVVAYNAAATIRDTIERLLAVDYPSERRQLLVVSDGSTDETDRAVGELAHLGVELHRVESRGGKTAAENAVTDRLRGEIIVNADASALVAPGAVKALVRHFADPAVGVASGRAVSVPAASGAPSATRADATYYSYEMWVRSLEMRFGAVVGATGALYAVRRPIFVRPLAPYATRDFATPLVAHEHGFRSVIDNDATCFVRLTPSLRREYHRKVRTMLRGLDTLFELRHLMDPMRHGGLAVMLLSHKLCRWLVYLFAPLAAAGVVLLAIDWWPARALVAAMVAVTAVGIVALVWPPERHLPAPLGACGYALVAGAAGATAWWRFLNGEHAIVWEPTKRVAVN